MSGSAADEKQRRIDEALARLAIAERVLELALTSIQSGTRADKMMVSEAVRTAFDTVAAARQSLARIVDGPES